MKQLNKVQVVNGCIIVHDFVSFVKSIAFDIIVIILQHSMRGI